MATSEAVMRIVIQGSDQASAAFRSVAREAQETGKVVEEVGEKTRRAFDSREIMASINKVSNALLGIGAAGMGVAAVVGKIGLELNKSIYATGAVAGATGEQLKELERVAREVGKTTMVSAKDAADAMYFLASAGFETQQVMEALSGVTRLAEATFSDVALSSQLVVNTLSQFGLAAGEATRVADVMVKTTTISQATIQKLADSLKYAGPVASAFGLSLEEVNAALAVFYNAGLSGQQAGTSLRNILLSLADPSKEAAETIKALGLSLEQVDPSKHNLAEIAEAFSRAGVTANQLSAIVGKEATAAMLALINNAGSLKELTAELNNAAGAAENLAEQMRKSEYGQYQMAVNQLKELAYAAFPAVAQAIQTLAKPLLDLVNWFNSLPEGVQQTITKFLVWGSVIALVAGGVGKLITVFHTLSEALKTLMSIDFAKHIATWTAKAIEFIKVDMVGTLTQWAGAFKTFAATAGASIATVAGVVAVLIYDIYKAIELIKILSELGKIKKETKEIERTTRVSEVSAELARAVGMASPEALEQLKRAAREFVDRGVVRTIQEGLVLAASSVKTGPAAEVLRKMPELMEKVQRVTVDVKVKVDTADFDKSWTKLGQNLKDTILRAVWEGTF